jgi:hypothetical protein
VLSAREHGKKCGSAAAVVVHGRSSFESRRLAIPVCVPKYPDVDG